MTTLTKLTRLGFLLYLTLPVVSLAQTTPEELANAIGYSVPASPAFELLPSKPSEVSNMITPKDVMATVPTFVSNGRVKTGLAADIRPFSYLVKASLTDYQKNRVAQAFWRTVLAVGTAPDPTNNNDAFLSVGLRMTIIDKGDPRTDPVYTTKLAEAYAKSLGKLEPPKFGESLEQAKKRMEEAAIKEHEKGMLSADSLRKLFNKTTWNKTRVNLGVAFMARALNSSYRSDSLQGDRWGGWLAASLPLCENAQLNLTTKATSIIRTPTEQSETGRYVAGARFRIFLNENVAFSVEAAQLWSIYSKSTNLNENWRHFATILEINVPQLGGWLTLGYGGDTAHRTASESKFSFSYAVASNRIFKK